MDESLLGIKESVERLDYFLKGEQRLLGKGSRGGSIGGEDSWSGKSRGAACLLGVLRERRKGFERRNSRGEQFLFKRKRIASDSLVRGK